MAMDDDGKIRPDKVDEPYPLVIETSNSPLIVRVMVDPETGHATYSVWSTLPAPTVSWLLQAIAKRSEYFVGPDDV